MESRELRVWNAASISKAIDDVIFDGPENSYVLCECGDVVRR
jgi:hypothetical protein